MASAPCLFCRIISRQLPAEIVAETETLLAFKDINPQAPVHLLLVTKAHLPSLTEVTPSHTILMGEVIQFANQLARDQQISQGYRVVINCGSQAGQSVFHLHLHLLGGRAFQWPPG